MTYADLYRAADTWTARHVAQDLMLENGRNTEASGFDLQTVSDLQVKEGGEAIRPVAA